MALEATHIRFALDLQNNYAITDHPSYITGAIYPDSRYVTGIDRNLTHHREVLTKQFADNDFAKGWQAHYICDVLQDRRKTEIFPELNWDKLEGQEWWIATTALKIVSDISDIQKFDLQSELPHLDLIMVPNGEEYGKMKFYNQLIKNFYLGKAACAIDDYRESLSGFGIDRMLIDRIILRAKQIGQSSGLTDRLERLYNDSIKDSRQYFDD